MPRIARAIATGFPHHVVQRGNNRETVFFEGEDYDNYLSLLKKLGCVPDLKEKSYGVWRLYHCKNKGVFRYSGCYEHGSGDYCEI